MKSGEVQINTLARSLYSQLIMLTNILNKLKANFFSKAHNITSQSIWDSSSEQYIKHDFKIYWETLSRVSEYQFRCMTGDEKKDYLTYTIEYVRDNIGMKNLRGLSIGCGEMAAPEMVFMQTGYFRRFDVMDIAEGLLRKQDQLAQNRGLKGIIYSKQDLNNFRLEDDIYDLIWAVGTIHHIQELENLFDQVNNSLKERGIFVMREYVGPNRIQLSDRQLGIVNEILSSLPDKYKRMPYGSIKDIEKRVKKEKLIAVDPSEAIRSQEILPIMRKNLEIIHFANTGGTILQPLLNQIASNFERDADGDAILRTVILLERTMIESGILPSDYVFCMAKKKIS